MVFGDVGELLGWMSVVEEQFIFALSSASDNAVKGESSDTDTDLRGESIVVLMDKGGLPI